MPKTSTYQNQPILILDPEIKDPYTPFSFGLAKAEVIIQRMEDIKDWLKRLKDDSDRKDPPKQSLNLTPLINHTGKLFLISKYKAGLIIKYQEEIQQFVHEGTAGRHGHFLKKESEANMSRTGFMKGEKL